MKDKLLINRKKIRIKEGFICDVHLGKLVRYLRMMGIDVYYENHLDDEDIICLENDKKKTVLSRDRRLIENPKLKKGYRVRSIHPKEQLKEVLSCFQIKRNTSPLNLCLECGNKLKAVDKAAVEARLDHDTRTYYQDFFQCPACDKIYWHGSHYQKMKKWIKSLEQQITDHKKQSD